MAIMDIYNHTRLIHRESVEMTELNTDKLCQEVQTLFTREILDFNEFRNSCIRIIVRDLNGRTEYRLRKRGKSIEVFKY